MGKVRKFSREPEGSIITRNIKGGIDYIDSFCIEISTRDSSSVDYLTALLFTQVPGWVKVLLNLRNVLVKPFGLETGSMPEPENVKRSVHYNTGDRAVFFTVVERTGSEIVMAEDDRHLYFKVSVFVHRDSLHDHDRIYLTTLVQFHNLFGRLYFMPVKPFHRLIMIRMLKRFSCRCQ